MKSTQGDLDFLDAPFAKAQPAALDRRPSALETRAAGEECRVGLWKRFWDILILVVSAAGPPAGLRKKTARNPR